MFAQVLPNSFKVGNYVEVLPNDSIKIWYNCVGIVTNSKCANFYRVGKIDPEQIGVTGEFRDYNLNSKLIFKATMIDGKIEGKAFYYYPDGAVQATGNYVRNVKKNLWRYFYSNGDADMVLNFTDTTTEVIQKYDIKGNVTVSNGNGNYSGSFKQYAQCDDGFAISGGIKNGKMDGKWTLNGQPVEVFENGKLVKEENIREYGGTPNSSTKPLITISSFYPNENTQLFENSMGCFGEMNTLFKFKSQRLVSTFYPQLIEKIKAYPKLNIQWIIIGIEFDNSRHIKTLNVYSSKDDQELELFIYNYIYNLKGWQAAYSDIENHASLFFTIYINPQFGNEKVLIPAEYIYRKQFTSGAAN